jgi:hypothetical protein
VETARFISQISQAAERNPTGLRDIANDLEDITPPTRSRFIATIKDVFTRRTAAIQPGAPDPRDGTRR